MVRDNTCPHVKKVGVMILIADFSSFGRGSSLP